MFPPQDASGTAPDLPDRKCRNRTPPASPPTRQKPRAVLQARQTKVSRRPGNKASASSCRHAAATRPTSSTRSRPSQTSSLPSPVAFLCPSANKQTTAPEYSSGNTRSCCSQNRCCQVWFRPSVPIRRDSTAPPPDSCCAAYRSSPAVHTPSSDQKNLPGPTIPPHSNLVP